MGGVARSELVAAVTQAGGFGFLGMVREPLERIRDEVARVRQATPGAFGVNLIPAATDPVLLRAQIDLCIELRIPAVELFWDVQPDVISRFREAGITVVYQVGSAEQAMQAEKAGANALIAQGVEAGGHVWGRQPLAELLDEVLATVSVPVAAAGGIGCGRDIAQVLAQGAQAAVLGTALIATRESFAHDFHKLRLVAASATDTVLTEDFHINWPRHAAVRVLKNSVTRGDRGDPASGDGTVIGDEEGRPIYLFSTDSPLRSMSGDYEAMALYAGQGVGHVGAVEPAGQVIARMVAEAAQELRARSDAPVELASPVCYAAEFEENSMAAKNSALVALLNELLEAERAGARVTLESVADAQDAATRELIEAIHRDEVKWCGVLMRAIRHLQGAPGTKTGDFHGRAMAIGELAERLAFLNRGQGWVARKLRELLPQVDDPAIRDDLAEMLSSHESNLGKVNTLLGLPRR